MKSIVIFWGLRLLAPKPIYCFKITEKTEEAYMINRNMILSREGQWSHDTKRMRGNGVEKKSEHPYRMFMQMTWLFLGLFTGNMSKHRSEVGTRWRFWTQTVEPPYNFYVSEFSSIDRDYKDPSELGWGSTQFPAHEYYKKRTEILYWL